MKPLSALVLVLWISVPAYAQSIPSVPPGRFDVDMGGGWLGGAGFGATDANLRAAAQPPAPFRLFTVDSSFASASMFHVRAGYMMNGRLGVEGGVTISHPELRASVTDDAEAVPPITVAERIDQYSIDAGVIIMVRELALGDRTLPYVGAGAGYLRQLHEGQTVVEEGHLFHAGGGVKHWLLARDEGLLNGAGLRVDARLLLMSNGIAFEDGPRPHAAISGSFFLTF
jgi:hypothetical protein